MLSKEALKEFKQIYKEKFREELSDEEAYRRASKLLNLYKAIYCPSLRKQTNQLDYENNYKTKLNK